MAGSGLAFVGFLAPDSTHWQPGWREAASAGGDPGAYSPAACSRNANEAKNKCSTSERLSHRQPVGRCQRHGAPAAAYTSRGLAAPRVCTHVPGWHRHSHRPPWPSAKAQATTPGRGFCHCRMASGYLYSVSKQLLSAGCIPGMRVRSRQLWKLTFYSNTLELSY